MKEKPERPVVNSEIISEAANRVSVLLEGTCGTNNHISATSLLKHYKLYMDGYELAKSLENDGWYADIMLASRLDNMDLIVWEIHRDKCREWVEKYNITPPLKCGTKIKQGRIDSLSEHYPACYLVKPYSGGEKVARELRVVVKFEDAKAI